MGTQLYRRSPDAERAQLEQDVSLLLDALEAGHVGIVPLDVAYAVNAMTEAGVRKIFDAKQRSYDKPSGMFASHEISRAVHVMDDWKHDLARTIVKEENIPFSIVAPFRTDHPFLASVEPFVLASSTKAGTLDMLLNAGTFHNEIARQSWERARPVFGSSANTSLQGSKYTFDEIEQPVRDAAEIAFDYGRSKYANDLGRSSTIVDFRDFSVIRVGVVYDRVQEAFERHGGIRLADDPG